MTVFCFFLAVSLFGVTPNGHNLPEFQYEWTAAAAIDTHRKPQPSPLIG